MSKLNYFLIFLIVSMIAYAQISPSSADEGSFLGINTTASVTPTLTPTPTPVPVATPAVIDIPKINVHALVDPVGTDIMGKMLMPEDVNKVAWYSGGAKPGENGNAVIAGHLDLVTGAPALFWNLKQLEPGDEITVTAQDAKVYNFVVTSKQDYPYDQVPMENVFGAANEKHLNLMTCSGTWDPIAHNYSNRIVIYTTLKN